MGVGTGRAECWPGMGRVPEVVLGAGVGIGNGRTGCGATDEPGWRGVTAARPGLARGSWESLMMGGCPDCGACVCWPGIGI